MTPEFIKAQLKKIILGLKIRVLKKLKGYQRHEISVNSYSLIVIGKNGHVSPVWVTDNLQHLKQVNCNLLIVIGSRNDQILRIQTIEITHLSINDNGCFLLESFRLAIN